MYRPTCANTGVGARGIQRGCLAITSYYLKERPGDHIILGPFPDFNPKANSLAATRINLVDEEHEVTVAGILRGFLHEEPSLQDGNRPAPSVTARLLAVAAMHMAQSRFAPLALHVSKGLPFVPLLSQLRVLSGLVASSFSPGTTVLLLKVWGQEAEYHVQLQYSWI